jgi:cell division septum initiation protein DivIVA
MYTIICNGTTLRARTATNILKKLRVEHRRWGGGIHCTSRIWGPDGAEITDWNVLARAARAEKAVQQKADRLAAEARHAERIRQEMEAEDAKRRALNEAHLAKLHAELAAW